MIDIHQHLIYGVDDGSPDLETSLAMTELAIADGITHVVCTPHSNEQYEYPRETIRERFEEIQSHVAGRLKLSLGCDCHMSAENVTAAVKDPTLFSINGNGYLLIEFSNNSIGPSVLDAVFRLQTSGSKIIVTHPERYPAVQRHPELVAEFIRRGWLIQVTAGSLHGRSGSIAQTLANEYLDRNWIHFLATDGHRVDWRPPLLKHAYDYVANKAGEETARRLCVENPLAVVEGRSLAEQPEALGIWDEKPIKIDLRKAARQDGQNKPDPAGGKGFFARLFGK